MSSRVTKEKGACQGSTKENNEKVYFTYILDSIDWMQPQIVYDGSPLSSVLKGESFVNTLEREITNYSTLKERELDHVKLLFSVGSEDLYTYISINQPFEGIVQERPIFTNINNGIGLFGSRYNESFTMWNAGNPRNVFSQDQRRGIYLELKDLRFIYNP